MFHHILLESVVSGSLCKYQQKSTKICYLELPVLHQLASVQPAWFQEQNIKVMCLPKTTHFNKLLHELTVFSQQVDMSTCIPYTPISLQVLLHPKHTRPK